MGIIEILRRRLESSSDSFFLLAPVQEPDALQWVLRGLAVVAAALVVLGIMRYGPQ